ncbi:MAG: hypothetical protein AAF921_23285 [Cyanobacteria bacterium P01_D01_bin.44]
MALFLVTCVIDEGVYDGSFRVVEANSVVDVAGYMLSDYDSWRWFLKSSLFYIWLYDREEGPTQLWESMNRVILNREDSDRLESAFSAWFKTLTPERLLEWIGRTRVDGDSSAQLAIHEIKVIEKVD